MKPFLILQLRPETEAADEEFAAFLEKGGLSGAEVRRIRLDEGRLPALSLDDFAGIIVGGGPAASATRRIRRTQSRLGSRPTSCP
jgi:GMP synthase (glutamine-hydrolysing)